jgi:hypothetical protein
MRPFLGRVPLRVPGSRSLGQVEFTDPWGGVHRVTVEPPPPEIPPFDPRRTPEEMERRAFHASKIKGKEQECEILKANMEAHKSHYFDREESGDTEYQNYTDAVDAYNGCLDKIAALEGEMDTAPVDFGTESGYEWPPEIPNPSTPLEEQLQHQPPLDVPSVDWRTPSTAPHELNEWPEEVPYPTGEPVPPPEPPELIETPPPVASVDWRTTGCPAGTARLVRGGMCVSSGLVSSALTTPMTTATPFTMGRAMLGQVHLVRRPGAF